MNNPNASLPFDGIVASLLMGEAIHDATSRGVPLGEVLAYLAKVQPRDFVAAAGLAREFAKEWLR